MKQQAVSALTGNYTSRDHAIKAIAAAIPNCYQTRYPTCHTVRRKRSAGFRCCAANLGVPFQHPVDLGDLTQVNCADCHTGA